MESPYELSAKTTLTSLYIDPLYALLTHKNSKDV